MIQEPFQVESNDQQSSLEPPTRCPDRASSPEKSGIKYTCGTPHSHRVSTMSISAGDGDLSIRGVCACVCCNGSTELVRHPRSFPL